jgi:hypothetical protein
MDTEESFFVVGAIKNEGLFLCQIQIQICALRTNHGPVSANGVCKNVLLFYSGPSYTAIYSLFSCHNSTNNTKQNKTTWLVWYYYR